MWAVPSLEKTWIRPPSSTLNRFLNDPVAASGVVGAGDDLRQPYLLHGQGILLIQKGKHPAPVFCLRWSKDSPLAEAPGDIAAGIALPLHEHDILAARPGGGDGGGVAQCAVAFYERLSPLSLNIHLGGSGGKVDDPVVQLFFQVQRAMGHILGNIGHKALCDVEGLILQRQVDVALQLSLIPS